MLRRLKRYIRTVSSFFQNDINEINAQNWAALRILTWVYLAALIALYLIVALPAGLLVQRRLVGGAILAQLIFSVSVAMTKQPPKGRYSSALPLLLFGSMIMLLVIFRNAFVLTDERAPLFPLALVMMSLYYTLPPEIAGVLLIGYPAVFLVVSHNSKTADAFSQDALLTVAALGIALSSYASSLAVRIRLWQKHCELQRIGSTDALTGVMNRKAFIAAFEAHIAKAPESFAFAIADIDQFKQFNDSYVTSSATRSCVTCASTERSISRRKTGLYPSGATAATNF